MTSMTSTKPAAIQTAAWNATLFIPVLLIQAGNMEARKPTGPRSGSPANGADCSRLPQRETHSSTPTHIAALINQNRSLQNRVYPSETDAGGRPPKPDFCRASKAATAGLYACAGASSASPAKIL